MKKFLTPQELSAALGIKLQTIYNWTHQRKIPRVKHLRLLRFDEEVVLKWLQGAPQKPEKRPEPKKRPKVRVRSSCEINRIVEKAKTEVSR